VRAVTDEDDRLYRATRRKLLVVFVPFAIALAIGWGWAVGSIGIGLLVGIVLLLGIALGLRIMRSLPPFNGTHRG
jgi:hypothetical protein